MREKKPKVRRYPRQTPELYEKAVLDIVAHYPQLGVERIAQVLPKIAGKPIVGYHGVQKILERYSLNTYEQRVAYARAQITPVIRLISALEEIGTRFIILPVETRAKIVRFATATFFTTFATTVVLGFAGYMATIAAGVPVSARIGLFFATIALSVGSIFFAYSMKYYLILAIVLSFSRQPLEEGGGYAVGLNGRVQRDGRLNNNNQKNGPSTSSGWLARIFGMGNGNGNGRNGVVPAGGLQPSLEHIKLKRYPFVSIHLPFYNEKKVAERILEACTSMDYPNYEIVVCDDSTDKTIEIVQRYAKEHNQTHPEGPKIKVLHRPTREGFKGGALAYALKHTNPKTEFVVVFDADFIPYPDTLELFIKYFKANNNNNNSEDYIKSNVAVVGGYQWHVLNKSENWITRGVRTEYAGSYVIERPGREIMGMLKQISGSVYMIRADVLKKIGWGTSITEDFELTLRLYAQGYKVIYTPYIQGPAECVSTLKRLIRQRMRWAEGHSNCIKKMFFKLMTSPNLTLSEKLEVLYISPY
ncbi:glycosyltransferase family 2 protein, partial [Patescibacteria group bacterium]|nr:glycosyltransferase family 2 protein [Patescibacteria group bacterium]